MAAVVYFLCFLTSLACSVLLLRAFKHTGARLLLWSGLCFVGMAINNGVLFADKILFPGADLYLLRTLPLLAGLMLLIYGLIWEAE
ncbi:MAG: DUF5985 family protein [Fimbriimonas sp.]